MSSSPRALSNTPCCARPLTKRVYSSRRRFSSVAFACSIRLVSAVMFRDAPSSVACRRFTLSASMHTLSML